MIYDPKDVPAGNGNGSDDDQPEETGAPVEGDESGDEDKEEE